MIKCKRCFKKYDTSEDACPRCGKLNVFVDEREYSHSVVKDHEHTIEKEHKGSHTCKFCGKKTKKDTKPCTICGNGAYGDADNMVNFSSRHFTEMIDNYHEKTNSVNFQSFKEKVKTYNIPLAQWAFPKHFTAGTAMSIKQVALIFVPLLFFNTGMLKNKYVLILYPSLLIFAWLMSMRFFKDYLITKDFEFKRVGADDIKITHTKDKKKIFAVNASQLRSVFVEMTHDRITNIAFEHRPDVKVKEADYTMDTSKYIDIDYIKYILFIMCYKFDIEYHIKVN